MKIEEKTEPEKVDWQKIIEEQEKIGLSQAVYCRRHSLNATKFSYHRVRFKTKHQLANSNPAEFKSVKISQSIPAEGIKVFLPNGFHCEFKSNLSLVIDTVIYTLP